MIFISFEVSVGVYESLFYEEDNQAFSMQRRLK